MRKQLNVIAGLCAGATILVLAACGSAPAPTATSIPPTGAPAATAESKEAEPQEEVAKPSNPGGPGEAVSMAVPASELFRFVLGAVAGHRLRSTLSVLGVGIGVAAVVLLSSLGRARASTSCPSSASSAPTSWRSIPAR